MGHLHTDMTVKGSGSAVKLKSMLIDTGATYITFTGAQSVIGVETLESVGMKLDPARSKLEFTRPKGMAYFFSGR